MASSATQPTPIAVAVVEHDGRFLVGVRPEGTALAGYSEFPGGKVQSGETARAAAERECLEETGLAVIAEEEYPAVNFEYPHGRVHLQFFACRPTNLNQAPAPRFRWVAAAELAALLFPEANAALIALLIVRASGSTTDR